MRLGWKMWSGCLADIIKSKIVSALWTPIRMKTRGLPYSYRLHLDKSVGDMYIRVLLRLDFQVAHPILNMYNFGHWSKMTLKKSFSYFLPKLQNQLTKNGHKCSKKCLKNGSFQKMSITKNVPLKWYCSMKIF